MVHGRKDVLPREPEVFFWLRWILTVYNLTGKIRPDLSIPFQGFRSQKSLKKTHQRTIFPLLSTYPKVSSQTPTSFILVSNLRSLTPETSEMPFRSLGHSDCSSDGRHHHGLTAASHVIFQRHVGRFSVTAECGGTTPCWSLAVEGNAIENLYVHIYICIYIYIFNIVLYLKSLWNIFENLSYSCSFFIKWFNGLGTRSRRRWWSCVSLHVFCGISRFL